MDNKNEKLSGEESFKNPAEILAKEPDFEEHIRKDITPDASVGLDNETENNQESLSELRDRFVNEDYTIWKWDRGEELSSVGALQTRLEKILAQERKSLEIRDLQSRDNIENEIEKGKKDLQEAQRKMIVGEWNPNRIAEKYGSRVEKYGVSLADINDILSERSLVDYTKSPEKLRRQLNTPQYEYFCEEIPNIIEKHFSDDVSEEHKTMLASVIKKYEQREYDMQRYLDNSEVAHKTERPADIEVYLSEEEIDFLAKEYSEASVAAGNSSKDVCSGGLTDDEFLDGLMYSLYPDPLDDYMSSKMKKKIEKYMQK